MIICNRENCTGCGVCANVCPKKCISMKENNIGIVYPVVNEKDCIGCNACKRICPQLNKAEFNLPIKAYAAWSSDEEERRTSASGGIAAEVYKYAIKNGMYVVGADTDFDFSVKLRLTNKEEELRGFKNSKYVFSEPYEVYDEIKQIIKNNNKAILIGTSCQIAAMVNLYGHSDNIIMIDVVCHGMTPNLYLKQHIKNIENKCNNRAYKISFRDPEKKTENYYLSLYDNKNRCFYSKRTIHGDTYQFGYHRAVSYRENCYNCIYAGNKRISDITLSDYKGLGVMKPCEYDNTKVSSVLVNTSRGNALIEELINSERITAEERPVEEPINGDPQLQHASLKTAKRLDFERYIKKYNGNFEKAIVPVIRREKIRNRYKKVRDIVEIIRRKYVK